MIERWVGFWSRKESPTAIVMIRVLVGLVVLFDLLEVGWYGVATWLWAPIEAGGVSPVPGWTPGPLVYQWFDKSASTATAMYVVLLITIVFFTVGFFTRTSALVFVLVFAQTAIINDYSDRGIDRAIRIVMLILAFSECGKAWSIDAKIETGTWRGRKEVQAWARYLVLGQLVLMYCSAGWSKGGTRWHPWGGFAALYIVLQDPIFASADFAWVAHPVPYFFTQIGTAVTLAWEMTIPTVLLAAWYRQTADRPGRIRAWFNRHRIRTIYVIVGAGFHVALMLTTRLGIFPWAMLAFYPAFYRPEEIESAVTKIQSVISSRAS